MASGNVPVGGMPMQFYPPSTDEKPSDADFLPSKKVAQTIKTYIFTTTSRLQSQPSSPPTPYGSLCIGVKVICGISPTATTPQVNGVNYSYVKYTPCSSSGVPGSDVDISASVMSTQANTGLSDMQFVKCADHSNPWSFNIIVKNYSDPDATFSGNLQLADGSIHDFSGQCIDTHDQVVQVTEGLPLPAKTNMEQLRTDLNVLENEITPLQAVAASPPKGSDSSTSIDGQDNNTTEPDRNPYPDVAQRRGNEIMQNLMTHALDGTPGAQIMGTIPPIEDPHQQQLLNDNMDFFQRGSVHTLCEQIKLQNGMDTSVSDHIAWKYNLYMNMLTSPPPLPGATGTQLTWDPATMYGLDRSNREDANLLTKLQSQYQTVSMSTYEMGYTEKCSMWADFTPNAEYWFKAYAKYLRSDEHKAMWAAQSAGQITETVAGLPSPVVITGQDKVRIWANKLSLLQHAAQRHAAKMKLPPPKLDIEPVVNDLLNQLHEQAAYSQIVDQAFIDEAIKMIAASNSASSSLSKAFQTELAKMRADAQEGGRELYTLLPHVLTLLNNPKSAMYQRLRDYIASRSPGCVAPENFTISDMVTWVKSADFSEFETKSPAEDASSNRGSSLTTLRGDDESTKALNTIGSKWIQRVKTNFKTLFRVAIHVCALVVLYSAVAGTGSAQGNMPQYQMNTAICALATEGVSLVGDAVGAVFRYKGAQWAIDKGGITKSASAWFTKSIGAGSKPSVARAMVGDFSKVMRLLGVVGCIFNLVTSYNCMNATGEDPNDPNVQNERYFNKWYFSLGVVEGAALVGGIITEAIGFELGAAVCGPLGMVVGAAALVVMLVQMFAFPPDPYATIKDWMTGLPTQFGSWCPNATITGPFIVQCTPPILGPGQAGIPTDTHSSAVSTTQTQPSTGASTGPVTGTGTDTGPQTKTSTRVITINQQTYAEALHTAFAAYLAAVKNIDNHAWQIVSDTVRGMTEALDHVIAGGNWQLVDELLTQTWTDMTSDINLLEKKGHWNIDVPNTANAMVPYNALVQSLQTAETQFWTYWIDDIQIESS